MTDGNKHFWRRRLSLREISNRMRGRGDPFFEEDMLAYLQQPVDPKPVPVRKDEYQKSVSPS